MGAALVTTREGLEASLIVGIVLAYLAKTDNRQHFRTIWAGTAAAVLVSAVTGAALFFTVGELEGRAEQIFEGVAMLSAVAVLTWMIFWMRKQAMGIKRELETRLQGAIAAGSAVGLASVVFFAVVREGWETALFLFAISESSTPLSTSVGAVLGLVVSISLGVALYMGSRKLNLRQFFTATGILLIVFAAGPPRTRDPRVPGSRPLAADRRARLGHERDRQRGLELRPLPEGALRLQREPVAARGRRVALVPRRRARVFPAPAGHLAAAARSGARLTTCPGVESHCPDGG